MIEPGRGWAKATPGAVLACLIVVLPGAAGCAGTTMSAARTRVPVLVGPVACIGCAAAPVPVRRGPGVQDASSFTLMIGWGAGMVTSGREIRHPTLALKTDQVLRDPCRGEMRVVSIEAKTLGVYALIFAMNRAEVAIDATPFIIGNGSCASPDSPGPPSGQTAPGASPTGIAPRSTDASN